MGTVLNTLAAILLPTSIALCAPLYHPLALQGNTPVAHSVNASGLVCGYTRAPTGGFAGTWWDSAGHPSSVFGSDDIYSINDAGIMVARGGGGACQIVDTSGVFSLPVPSVFSHPVEAFINNNNQVLVNSGNGQLFQLNPATHKLSTIATLAFSAHDMNDNGDVAGTNGSAAVVRYADGTQITVAPPPGYASIRYEGINNSGTITGYYTDDAGLKTGFTSTPGEGTVFLPTLPGFTLNTILGIANDGTVLGTLIDFAKTTGRTVVWQGGSVYDLRDTSDDAAYILGGGRVIGHSGQLVAAGTLDGASRVLLLSPVPEPSTLTLLIAPLLYRRRAVGP